MYSKYSHEKYLYIFIHPHKKIVLECYIKLTLDVWTPGLDDFKTITKETRSHSNNYGFMRNMLWMLKKLHETVL